MNGGVNLPCSPRTSECRLYRRKGTTIMDFKLAFLVKLPVLPGSSLAGAPRSARSLGLCLTTRSGDVAYAAEKPVLLAGRNGGVQLRVPLGLGAWSFGDRFYWGSSSEEDNTDAVRESLRNGVTLIDTAEVYGTPPGRSEQLVGRIGRQVTEEVLANAGPDSPLPEINVATKYAPFPWRTAGLSLNLLGWLSRPQRRETVRRSVLGALRASMRRLGLENIDLYQQHWPAFVGENDEPIWDALAEAYHEGLIRCVGVSNFSPSRLLKCDTYLRQVHEVPLASNQVQWSLLHRDPETVRCLGATDDRTLCEICADRGIQILAYSPLAQGLLTGRYRKGRLPSGVRKRLAASLVERVDVLLSEMERIAAKRQVSLAAVALNYVITAGEMRAAGEKPTIAIPIPGAKNAWQAQQNAQALGWRLDLDEMTKLRRAADQVDAKLPSIPLARESNRRGL